MDSFSIDASVKVNSSHKEGDVTVLDNVELISLSLTSSPYPDAIYKIKDPLV